MKEVLKYFLFIPVIFLLSLTSCANSAGGGGGPSISEPTASEPDTTEPSANEADNSGATQTEQKLNFIISDVNFDSFTCILTAKTNLPNGSTMAAFANNHAESAVVSNGSAQWTMGQSFNAGVKGGKDYTITFSAEGYNNVTASVSYFPLIKYELGCDENELLFCHSTTEVEGFGQAPEYQLPEIYLKNYDDEDVYVNWKFSIDSEIKTLEEFKKFLKEDSKEFIKTKSEDGETPLVLLKYEIYPKATEGKTQGNALCDTGTIKYELRNETRTVFIRAEYQAGAYEAKTYTANPDETSGAEETGGLIFYQWEISPTGNKDGTDWEIIGEYGKTYKLKESDVGKYLRVQMFQIMEESLDTDDIDTIPLTSAPTSKILNGIKSASLNYVDTLKTGDAFNPDRIELQFTTIFGSSKFYSNIGGNITVSSTSNSYQSMQNSQDVEVTLNFDNFEPYDAKVYVTVQHKNLEESELPALSTEISKITDGHVDFKSINSDLEFSKDNMQTWTDMPASEFTANAGDIFYFRKKATGTANTNGYIKESQPASITVQSKNIGKATSGGTFIDSLKYTDLKLVKSTKNGTITLTPVLTHTQPYYFVYKVDYEINGTSLANSAWAGKGPFINDKNCLVIPSGHQIGADNYQINCVVRVCIESDDGEETVLRLSNQISLSIQ